MHCDFRATIEAIACQLVHKEKSQPVFHIAGLTEVSWLSGKNLW
jgi:hypothetical protein